MPKEEIQDNLFRCPWCGNFVKRAERSTRTLSSLFTYERKCPFCEHHYSVNPNPFLSPMVRSMENNMPERGYKAEIKMLGRQSASQIIHDMIVPIIFIDDSGNAVSDICCVRIEDRRRSGGTIYCDLKLVYYGVSPNSETDKIYLFNNGQIIAYGKILQNIEISY